MQESEVVTWHCVAPAVLSESADAASAVLRRLRVGDKMDGQAAPRMEGPVLRVHVRSADDELGWVTVKSTSGKPFIVAGSPPAEAVAAGRPVGALVADAR